MKTKDALIAELDQAREKIHALLRDLDAAQEVYPTWTVKELLSHLSGWDDACIAALHAHASGSTPDTPAARGFNPFNAANISERQALSLKEVIQEFDSTREVFRQMILDLPDYKLGVPFVFPWGPTGTLEDMVSIFAEHDIEHAKEIRANHLK